MIDHGVKGTHKQVLLEKCLEDTAYVLLSPDNQIVGIADH